MIGFGIPGGLPLIFRFSLPAGKLASSCDEEPSSSLTRFKRVLALFFPERYLAIHLQMIYIKKYYTSVEMQKKNRTCFLGFAGPGL